MHPTSPFLSILIVTVLVALVPLLASRKQLFPLPIVIGEILAGTLIGKSGFDWITPSPILDFLSEFGFVFLMFLSGLEVDLSFITINKESQEKNTIQRKTLCLSVVYFILTLACSFTIAYKLTLIGLVENPLVLGLILSTTSLGIVVPVLKEKGVITSKYGQTLLLSALIADFATLIFLSTAFAFLKKGAVLQVILLLLFLAFVALSLRLGTKLSRSIKLQRKLKDLSQATSHIRVRGAIALMVVWASLAHVLGTEVILGAFIAGIIVNILAGPDEVVLREKLDVLGFGFFIPFFFIMVGGRFQWQILIHSTRALILFPILIGSAYLVKLLPALLFRLVFSWKETISGGFLLSSRLSLIIAASAVALQLGTISQELNANIILVAMVTCTVSPILFSRLAPVWEEKKRQGVIVVGTDQLTSLLIDRLQRDGEEVSLLSPPNNLLHIDPSKRFRVTVGDPTDPIILEEAGASRAAALAAVLDIGEVNLEVCRKAKELGIPLLISRTDDFTVLEKMKAMGVRVIQPALANAIALEGALRFPTTFDLLTDHGDNVKVAEATLFNSRLIGMPLSRIRLPGNVLVLGIRRKGEVIIPHGDTIFHRKDIVMLLGNIEHLKQAKALLEVSSDLS